MLSRRDLFKAAPAVAIAATAASCTTISESAPGSAGIKDLTHELHHDFPTYFG